MTLLWFIKYIEDLLCTHSCLMCSGKIQEQPKLCEVCLEDLPKLTLPITAPNLLLRPDVNRLFKQVKFDSLFAVLWYQEPNSYWLSKLKFHNKIYFRHVLIQIIQYQLIVAQKHMNWVWPDMIIIMPLHIRRYHMRGFNQVDQVWREALLTLPNFNQSLLQDRVLLREKYTKAQTNLNAKQRRKNISSAFIVTGDVKGKVVAVIDDVITTGTTINEVSSCLKAAGAKHVSAWATCLTPLEK